MALRLIIEDVDGSTTIVPLRDGTVTIGREADNTIQLTEQNVSRRHAKLTATGEGGWVVQDLSSYNGIQVNNLLVRDALQVHEGDLIRIGDYHLALTEDEDRQTVDLGLGERGVGIVAAEAEPMLASSSAHLPAISPEELEAIRSGEAPAVATLTPDLPLPRAEPEGEPEHSGGVGGKLVIGLLLVAGLVVGGWWFSQQGTGRESPVVAAKEVGDQPSGDESESALRASPAAGAATRSAEGGTGEVPEAPVLPEGGAGETDTGPANEAEGPPSEGDGSAPPVVGDVGSAPDDKPTKKAKKTASDKKKKAEGGPGAASESAVDADALLADARAAMLAKNWSKAYDLAKQSQGAKKSSGALSLMGLAACKMNQGSKAASAAAGLSGAKKEMLIKACAEEGVAL